ncbi:leucine dehydrogenase [Patescibacteria group bacterium]|nr:leucine dehydrogenase [Patescibacteria group bacterium]
MKDFLNFEIEKLKEFDNHKLVVILNDTASKLRGFISIHRGAKSLPSFGATRYWKYKSDVDALIDSLKLSRNMSYKSALAGLKYGGAKAVILNSAHHNKPKILRSYAQRVNSLGGRFITGADVGIDSKDLEVLASESDYIVGKKSDPAGLTSQGVFFSIQMSLRQVFGDSSIEGRTFAIQGVGKTGIQLLSLLYVQAGKVYVTDVDNSKLMYVKKRFPKVKIVRPWEIFNRRVDVFAPCALSNSITKDNVATLHCKIVVGSANNQLEDISVGESLQKMDILYAPDYVANAGGLIAVVDEFENKNFNQERVEKKLKKVQKTLQTIFDKHKKTKKPTNIIANKMAENIFNN